MQFLLHVRVLEFSVVTADHRGEGGRRLKGRKRRKQVAGGRDGGLSAARRRGGRDGTEAATKGRASSVVWSVLGTQILEIFVVFSSLDG